MDSYSRAAILPVYQLLFSSCFKLLVFNRVFSMEGRFVLIEAVRLKNLLSYYCLLGGYNASYIRLIIILNENNIIVVNWPVGDKLR